VLKQALKALFLFPAAAVCNDCEQKSVRKQTEANRRFA
jgi:hypothetical protein